jgi:hypothetical protein
MINLVKIIPSIAAYGRRGELNEFADMERVIAFMPYCSPQQFVWTPELAIDTHHLL